MAFAPPDPIYPDMKEECPRKKWEKHESADPPLLRFFRAEGYPMSFLN